MQSFDNIIKTGTGSNLVFANALKGLDNQAKINIVSQSGLNEAQKIGILATSGLSAEELKAAATSGTLSTSQKAATGSTLGLSTAFKGLAASLGISTVALGAITAGLATLAVGALAYRAYAQAQEESRQASADAAAEYENSTKAISDYTKRYEELQVALKKARGNEQETFNVKQQLLELQKDLNDKFGDEYGKLNLVTDAYNNQTEAIKNYNREVAKSYLNDISRSDQNTANERMTSDKIYNLNMGEIGTNSVEGNALQKLLEKYSNKGISSTSVDEMLWIYLEADPTSAEQSINEFMTDVTALAKELGDEHIFDDILNTSKSAKDEAKSIIDDWGDIYEKTLLGEIALNDALSDGMNKATEAVNTYNQAVLKSENPYDDENVKTAYDNLQMIKTGIEENEEEWSKYKCITDSVFDDADTKVYDFYNALTNDSSIKSLTEDLRGLTELDFQAMADIDDGDSFDKLCQSAKEYGLDIQDVINLLIKLGIVQENITSTVPFETSTVWTDDQKKAIKEAESVISGLQSAMDKLNKGDLSKLELSGLISEYNLDAEKATSSTEGLRNELERVAETNLNGIVYTLEVMRDGGYLTEEQFQALSDLFKELTDDISNTKEKLLTIPEALNALQSSSTAIENLNKNIKENKQITGDMISELMNKYPQLTDVLNDYLLGVASTADVINALQGVYDNDIRNYQLLCVGKKEYDTDFYNSVLAKLPTWVKELANSYGIDLSNFKNIAIAKAQVEETLIKKSGEAWAKYYSALNTAQQKAIPDFADYAAVHEAAWEANQYEKAKNEILDNINSISIDVANITAPTFSSSSKSGSGSKKSSGSKDTKETINWIDRKLDILEKKLSKLKAKADSVFGWSKKNTIVDKEIKNLESQIKVYEKAQNSYKKKYSKIKLSDDIISKIKNGSMDITAYDSKTAKKIKDYQDLYDKEQDCVDKITELRGEIKDLNQEKLDNIKSEFDRVISNSKSRVDEAQAKIDLKISLGEVVTEADYDVLLKETKYQQAKYQKEINELTKKAESQWKRDQKKYKVGSDDYNNARKQYHDQLAVINSLNTELIKEKQNQQEINQSILEIPLRPLERQKELIEQQISALDKLKSKYSDMIGVVTYYVGKQVDALNKAKEAITDTYDGMINPLKEQLEALQKQNEERQQAINLQKAQYELERAQNQKTISVMRDGKFQYEADLRKVREAKEAKDKAVYDNTVYNLQNQIKELESQRDDLLKGYDEQIDRLNKISDKWSQIIQDAEMLSKIDMFESTYGSLENIINGSDVAYDKIKSSVEQLQKSLDDFNKAKESLEDQIESIENYIKAWKNGEAEFTEIQNKITQVLNDHSAMNEDILLKSEETIAKYINDINGSTKELQKELDKSVDDTKEKLQSMDKPLDDLQIALDKVVQGYDRFVKLNSNLTSTIPLTVNEYVRLTEATDDFNTSVDNLSNKVAQFIPEMKKLDTVSVALKQSFETTSDMMQSISTGAIEKITVALDKLFNMVYLLNNEFGVEGVKALTDYIAKLTSTQTSVQQLDTLVKVFITTMKSLKTELNETQTAFKNLETAMGLAMEKLNQISTSAASASSNFASLSANINSAANAYYAFADAQKAANSAGASSLNSSSSIGLVGSSFGAALGALSLNSSIKGNALATGTRSAKEGVSLVGEEKPELVIHNSRGTFELVDQPSLINLDSGDTVLNGDETRNILSSRMSTLNPALLQTIQIPKFSPPRMDVPTFGNKTPEGNNVYADKVIVECLKDRGEDDAKDLVFALTHMDGLIYQNKLKRR